MFHLKKNSMRTSNGPAKTENIFKVLNNLSMSLVEVAIQMYYGNYIENVNVMVMSLRKSVLIMQCFIVNHI